MEKIGIYIHIPFCKSKCKYCDFISFSNCENKIEDYINSVIKEIQNYKDNHIISTIYFGGGTPSIIDSIHISRILENLYNKFNVLADCEITLEINPGTVNKEKLEAYKKIGINRLSIGLQSTENRILELIGRIHTYEQFLDTYNMAKEIGFDNINVDLMLAIPTQTHEELLKSVKTVISLNPNHISLYSLILEEGTELEKLIENKTLELLDDNTERKMYWETKQELEKNGYNHYEISNFSKKGFESKHNLNCWNQEQYIGFGLAAHSYIYGCRFSNIDNLSQYIENIQKNDFEENKILHEKQDKKDKMKEFMLIGLRKIEGVKISEFEKRFRINPLFYFRFEISKLTEEDLIEVDLDNIKLTQKGLDLANLVFEEFV